MKTRFYRTLSLICVLALVLSLCSVFSFAEVLEGLREMLEAHNRGCGQEQYEKTWEAISEGDHFQYFRNEVFDVMYEEAGRFFSGSSTAKQAAEYVQNRISLYLAEQG